MAINTQQWNQSVREILAGLPPEATKDITDRMLSDEALEKKMEDPDEGVTFAAVNLMIQLTSSAARVRKRYHDNDVRLAKEAAEQNRPTAAPADNQPTSWWHSLVTKAGGVAQAIALIIFAFAVLGVLGTFAASLVVQNLPSPVNVETPEFNVGVDINGGSGESESTTGSTGSGTGEFNSGVKSSNDSSTSSGTGEFDTGLK